MKKHYHVLIVGCGITGAVFAERAAAKGQTVLIIDRRDHIAGNCYDYNDNGITVHKYGPHIFHTDNEQVWRYLSQFTEWHPYMHRVLASVDGAVIPLPFNLNSIYQIFPSLMAQNMENKLIQKYKFGTKVPILELMRDPDGDLQFLANYIYEKVFKNYTLKQWGLKPEEIDNSVTARVPVSISRDNRYFMNKYQGIPLDGYTVMIKKMLSNSLIDVRLSTEYDSVRGDVGCDKLIFTGSIDGYFGYKHGSLPYRSIRFDQCRVNNEYFQKAATVNYPNNYDFTRITEFKHFLDEKTSTTVIMKEYPEPFVSGVNDPLYPIASKANQELYEKYRSEAAKENITFAGRLGDYKYYDMDKAVEMALAGSQ